MIKWQQELEEDQRHTSERERKQMSFWERVNAKQRREGTQTKSRQQFTRLK